MSREGSYTDLSLPLEFTHLIPKGNFCQEVLTRGRAGIGHGSVGNELNEHICMSVYIYICVCACYV